MWIFVSTVRLSLRHPEKETKSLHRKKTAWNEMTDGIAMVYGCSRFSRYVPLLKYVDGK